MSQLIKETSAALRHIVLGAYIFGGVFCAAGIAFVAIGTTGSTEFKFFGQTFKSTNVGIAALFLGAATVVLLIMRSIRTLNVAIVNESPSGSESAAPSGHWPTTKSLNALMEKIKTLSDTQWIIVKTVAKSEGISGYTFAERLHMGPSMFFHRLHTLQSEQLLLQRGDGWYLDRQAKQLLGSKILDELRGIA